MSRKLVKVDKEIIVEIIRDDLNGSLLTFQALSKQNINDAISVENQAIDRFREMLSLLDSELEVLEK